MALATGVSLEEYLHTNYEPDCDYVDGVLEERNVGQLDHGETQAAIAAFFFRLKRRLAIRVVTELRMRVSPTRVRIPDVAIVAVENRDQVLQRPPLLCIEILSPDDRLGRIAKVIADYLDFGVPMIWIVDPYKHEAFVVTQEDRAMRLVDTLQWKDVIINLSEIFPE
ncbi:MAG TPA: Uma2 family endonuclease [Bryobacteraceae bacterium]|jgi:Uma2 family endonuclease